MVVDHGESCALYSVLNFLKLFNMRQGSCPNHCCYMILEDKCRAVGVMSHSHSPPYGTLLHALLHVPYFIVDYSLLV